MAGKVELTEPRLRALREIEKLTHQNSAYPGKNRNRTFAESSYPVVAAFCFFAGWMDRIHQSETCKPSSRRYFYEYRLLPAGRALLSSSGKTGK